MICLLFVLPYSEIYPQFPTSNGQEIVGISEQLRPLLNQGVISDVGHGGSDGINGPGLDDLFFGGVQCSLMGRLELEKPARRHDLTDTTGHDTEVFSLVLSFYGCIRVYAAGSKKRANVFLQRVSLPLAVAVCADEVIQTVPELAFFRQFGSPLTYRHILQYLCRLVTPTGGTVLDPFCGSGSIGLAAKAEGLGYIGIDLEPEYIAIAERRISSEPPTLFSQRIEASS